MFKMVLRSMLSQNNAFVLSAVPDLGIKTLLFACILVVQLVNHPLWHSVCFPRRRIRCAKGDRSVCHFLASVSSILECDGLLVLELISGHLSKGGNSAGSPQPTVM